MARLLREPLVHFLVLGGLLFLVFALAGGDDGLEEDAEIVVSAGRIEQLAGIFAKTWQRPPTPEELRGLIDDFVLEEVYYRRAVAMGIDRDDTVIRRRLRQKLEFLTDDITAADPPDDDALAAYLEANPDFFRTDPTYTFEQVYINPEQHSEGLEAHVQARLAALRGGEAPAAGGLIPATFENATARTVDNTFGRDFAARLDGLELGEWQGPLGSGLGLHLVRLESRQEGTVPALGDIRPQVLREWSHQRRQDQRRALHERMLAEYEITIEWPDAEAAEEPASQP